MANTLEFAGVSLLLEDPGHEVQSWLDRYFSLDDLQLFGTEPIAYREGRERPRIHEYTTSLSEALAKVGVPIPNWRTLPPRLKINTLWVPTGAARYSVGLFLVDEDRLNKIIGNLSAAGNLLALREERAYGTRAALELNFTMYPLPAKPLTAPQTGSALYLLPLVDQRYFWQFADAGNLEIDEYVTWEQLAGWLASQLHIVDLFLDTTFANYYFPDPTEFTRKYENAAMLLDALAFCIGSRVVFNPYTQTCNIYDPDASEILLSANKSSTVNQLVAGGDSVISSVPAQVRVVFPRYFQGFQYSDGDVYYIISNSTAHTPLIPQINTIKTFFDTAHARFPGNPSTPGIPSNITELQRLTGQIAADYYGHRKYHHDRSYLGLVDWSLTGFDDWIWYHFGYQDPNAGYQCFTRVASVPLNFGVSELLHAFGEEVPPIDESTGSSVSTASTASSASSVSSVSATSTSSPSTESSGSVSSRSKSSGSTASSSSSLGLTSSSSSTPSSFTSSSASTLSSASSEGITSASSVSTGSTPTSSEQTRTSSEGLSTPTSSEGTRTSSEGISTSTSTSRGYSTSSTSISTTSFSEGFSSGFTSPSRSPG